ncbi:hypothetical protein J6590_021488 [Homalodisca vitripennis]|nr:hypothetical protein J6590_021488 [Homalodisca vitripennis]
MASPRKRRLYFQHHLNNAAIMITINQLDDSDMDVSEDDDQDTDLRRQDQVKHTIKTVAQLRKYKMDYGEYLIESNSILSDSEDSEYLTDEEVTPGRNPKELPSVRFRTHGNQLPEITPGVQQRCKNSKCSKKTSLGARPFPEPPSLYETDIHFIPLTNTTFFFRQGSTPCRAAQPSFPTFSSRRPLLIYHKSPEPANPEVALGGNI